MIPKVSLQVLVLSCNRRNLKLLAQLLDWQVYQVLPAICLERVAQTVTQFSRINLALINSGFDSRIWKVCQQREQEIPFLVSLRYNATIQQASITHGALGLL